MPSQLLEQLKARAANQLFGDPIPPGIVPPEHGASPYGASARVEQSGRMNNPAQTARAIDEARRGTAPMSFGNMSTLAGNMMGVMGSGALTTGLANLGEMAMGMAPGSLGGFGVYQDHMPYTAAERAAIARGVPIGGFRTAHQARHAAAGGGRSVEGNRARGGAGAFGGGQKTSSGHLGGAGGV